MTDPLVKDQMQAARQEMAQLLDDIVIAPLKEAIPALLDDALFPLDKAVKDGQEGLIAQVSKIKRVLDRHYPSTSVALDEQLHTLLSNQQVAQTQGSELANMLTSQAQTLNQNTLQVLVDQADALETRLAEHHQALQEHAQSQLQALSDLNLAANREGHERVVQRLAEVAEAHSDVVAQAGSRLAQIAQTLGAQVETVGQQALETVQAHNRALEAQLNDRDQAFQEFSEAQVNGLDEANQAAQRQFNAQLLDQLQRLEQERVKRLETLVVVLVNQTRASVAQAIARLEQRLKAVVVEQTASINAQAPIMLRAVEGVAQRLLAQDAQAGAQHQATSGALAGLQQHLTAQDARVEELQGKLQLAARQAKAMLGIGVVGGMLCFGALAYLVLRVG